MGGFVFKVGTAFDLDMSFDDADDLKEHPMLEQFVGMSFNDVFSMIGASRETFEDFDIDLSEFDESKMLADDQTKELYLGLKAMNAVRELIKAVD